MKILSILFMAAALLVSTNSFAGNGERLLKKKVSNAVRYPSMNASEKAETTVTAWITVDENGSVKVTGMTTSSPAAASAIKKQLEKITHLPTEELIGKTFAYRFVLKVQ